MESIEARRFSIQGRTSNLTTYYNIGESALLGALLQVQRVTDVPAWGVSWRTRDAALRRLFMLQGNSIIQSAMSAIIQKVQSTSWIMEGPAKTARYYHTLLHDADFGNGWEQFLSKVISDYLGQDNGMFIEILGDGDPEMPLSGPIKGIAHLDAGRCTRTGNLEHPVIYNSPLGYRYKIHYTRVYYQSDLPSSDERRLGLGFCALSRTIAEAQRWIFWSEMANEALDDMPPLAFLSISGMNKESFETQWKEFESRRMGQNQQYYRGIFGLFAANGVEAPDVKLTHFRQIWDGFTQKDLYDVVVDLTAMGFGLDRQELAPLATSSLGSGAQSTVLASKARGKGIGNILSVIERFINKITPPTIRFKFDFQDEAQDLQQANIAQVEANTILMLYTAAEPQSNKNIATNDMKAPVQDTTKQGLLSHTEARYLLFKKGILPRELLTPDERNSLDWETLDEITVKARKRYGNPITIFKDGTIRDDHDVWRRWRSA